MPALYFDFWVVVRRHGVNQHDCISFDIGFNCMPRTTAEIWTGLERLWPRLTILCSTRRSTSDTSTSSGLGLGLGPPSSLLCQCGGFGPPGGGGADGLRAPPTRGPGPLLAESCPALLVGWRRQSGGRGDGAERASRCSSSSGDDGKAEATDVFAASMSPRRASSPEFDVSLDVWGNGRSEAWRSSWFTHATPADGRIKRRTNT